MDRLEAYPQEVKDVIDYARLMLGGATGNARLFVFVPAPSRNDTYLLGVAVLGESGYISTMFSDRFDSYDSASAFCDKLHGALGYAEGTVGAIVADTMLRSQSRRDRKNGVVAVKMDLAQLEHAIEALDEFDDRGDTNVLDVLHEAKAELVEDTGLDGPDEVSASPSR